MFNKIAIFVFLKLFGLCFSNDEAYHLHKVDQFILDQVKQGHKVFTRHFGHDVYVNRVDKAFVKNAFDYEGPKVYKVYVIVTSIECKVSF